MTATKEQASNDLERVNTVDDQGISKDGRSTGFEENTAEEKALVRKIDLYLMPSIWFLYLLAYMDRSNIGNAKIAGMSRDLGLSDNDYSLAINLFQVSYVVFSVPSNMILSRTRASYYMSTIMGLWGIVVAAMAAAKTPAQLWGLRFALGALESGFSPAVMYVYSVWYRRHEQSKRFMVFWSAGILAGAFAGILAGLIASGLDGARGLAGWRWLFLVEGVITVGVAILSPLVLLDQPEQCRKFTPEQRALAIRRLQADGFVTENNTDNNIADNGQQQQLLLPPSPSPPSPSPPPQQQEQEQPSQQQQQQQQQPVPQTHHHKPHKTSLPKALWISLTTPSFWIIFIGFMMVDGSFSIGYFYPTLVEGLGYDSITAQFMTTPLYVVVLPIAIALSFLSDSRPRHRGLFLAATLLTGAVFSGIAAGLTGDLVARYVLMCLLNMAMYSAIPLALAWSTTELSKGADETTRAVALAVMSGLGNLAQVYSSYLWPGADAPGYIKGFATYAGLLGFGACLYFLGWFLFRDRPLRARKV